MLKIDWRAKGQIKYRLELGMYPLFETADIYIYIIFKYIDIWHESRFDGPTDLRLWPSPENSWIFMLWPSPQHMEHDETRFFIDDLPKKKAIAAIL